MLVDKISRINSKIKGQQIRCIPHGRWGLAQCKSTCEEHAGSDKRFENISLCLDQLPLKIQLTKEKRTLKTLVLSREANTLPQCRTSWFWEKFERKTLFFKAAALNAIYEANQSTICPFKLEIILKLAHLLGPLEQTTNSTQWITQLNTPENTITYHNALCFSPQNFA